MTEKVMQLTMASGSEWVMYLLLALSVASLAVAFERLIFIRTSRARLDRIDAKMTPMISTATRDELAKVLETDPDDTLHAAVAERDSKHADASAKLVGSVLERERLRLEARLTFLGTLGNNAPFIGLFGTVLGIIRAFHDLSMDAKGGSSAVMSGISEALVATAIGLFVAIPAVIAYNYFQKQVDHVLSIKEALAQSILAGGQVSRAD